MFYTPAILVGISFSLLIWLYHPPKHPRGIPWHEAVKQLDYFGAFLFTIGATLVFTGVIYTTIISPSNAIVIGLLCSGFGVIVIFALWERYADLKQALTPPKVFAQDKGREFLFPFISGTIVNMFFYSVNIVYPTMINVFWTDPTSTVSYQCQLTLPQGLGLITGSMMLWFFGIKIGHWKIQYVVVFALMTLFGALLALGKPDNMAMIMVFTFITEAAYGWAQTLSITWIQFGVPQTELGISGALAGVARWTGGALSSSIYLAILSNVQISQAKKLIPAAAMAAGANQTTADMLITAIGAGTAADVPGATTAIIEAAGAAFKQTYVVGLRTVCLVSIAFGVVGTICCALSNDIGPKMNNKSELPFLPAFYKFYFLATHQLTTILSRGLLGERRPEGQEQVPLNGCCNCSCCCYCFRWTGEQETEMQIAVLSNSATHFVRNCKYTKRNMTNSISVSNLEKELCLHVLLSQPYCRAQTGEPNSINPACMPSTSCLYFPRHCHS